MSGFDYPYTCPTIDKEIETIQDTIFEHVERLIESITLYVPEEVITKLANEYAATIYKDIGMHVESIRNTNEDIRYAAEKQIDTMSDKIRELETTVKDWEIELENLKDDFKNQLLEVERHQDYLNEA